MRRSKTLKDRLINCAVPNTVDKGLYDLEIDVRLQQRQPYLAQRGLDRLRGEPHLASKRFKDFLKPSGEGIKHGAGGGSGRAPLTCDKRFEHNRLS